MELLNETSLLATIRNLSSGYGLLSAIQSHTQKGSGRPAGTGYTDRHDTLRRKSSIGREGAVGSQRRRLKHTLPRQAGVAVRDLV